MRQSRNWKGKGVGGPRSIQPASPVLLPIPSPALAGSGAGAWPASPSGGWGAGKLCLSEEG